MWTVSIFSFAIYSYCFRFCHCSLFLSFFLLDYSYFSFYLEYYPRTESTHINGKWVWERERRENVRCTSSSEYVPFKAYVITWMYDEDVVAANFRKFLINGIHFFPFVSKVCVSLVFDDSKKTKEELKRQKQSKIITVHILVKCILRRLFFEINGKRLTKTGEGVKANKVW